MINLALWIASAVFVLLFSAWMIPRVILFTLELLFGPSNKNLTDEQVRANWRKDQTRFPAGHFPAR